MLRINKNYYLIIFLSLIIFEYSLYIIGTDILDKIIKILVPVVIFFLFKNYELSKERIIILCLYTLLFCCAFSFSNEGTIQWLKFLLMFLIFPLTLLKFPKGKQLPDTLVKFFIVFGVVFSIQAIILSLIIFLKIPIQPETTILARYHDMKMVSYGILGYANAVQSPYSNILILRSQGWFLEPSLLACFLIYPITVSFGYYLENKRKFYLISSILCFCALLTTFSLAGFISILAASIMWITFRIIKSKRTRIIALGLSVLIVILISYAIIQNLNNLYTQQEGPSLTRIIARNPDGPSGNIFRENYMLDTYYKILKDNPFGLGFENTAQSDNITSANALVFWIIAGGFPAVIIILGLYFKLVFSFCLPLLQQEYLPYSSVAAAFIGVTLHNLSYGNWINPFYLYIVALMILCYDDYNFNGKWKSR